LNSEQTFQIDIPPHPSPRSFTYPFGTSTGFLEPTSPTPTSTTEIPFSTLQLFVASQFAQHIRAELFSNLGYTTSAGIAPTKLVAKLLSDLHKPALQSIQNPHIPPSDLQSWLDTFKVEKLNGFGFRTGWILRNKILGEEMPARGMYGEADKHNGSFMTEEEEVNREYSEGLLNGRPSSGSLSVGKVRLSCTEKQFYEWFGGRLGSRLWELLHGIDSAEVIPTPAFPKQISVEDSYPDNRTLPVLFENLGILTKSLVRRLDLDLKVGEGYIRFPRTLRLSMRNGRQVARESKSARMPVELFDLNLPVEKRIECVRRVVNSLAKGIIAGWPSDWRVGVINVCATELMEDMPGRGIQGFIENPRKVEEVDWDVIKELPEDIRMEVMRQYHLSPDLLKEDTPVKVEAEEESRGKAEEMVLEDWEEWEDPREAPEISKTKEDPDMIIEMLDEEEEWDDGDDAEMEDTRLTCDICGVRIFSWMEEAHSRYHGSIG
jgi:DNA polymerase iota